MSREAASEVARQRLAFWSATLHLATKATTEMLPASSPPHLREAFQIVANHAGEQVGHWKSFIVPVQKPIAR